MILAAETNNSLQTTTHCYNKALDDEIRSRLDKLNALSDLINSLECKFDQANTSFRETLKCSTDRLSSIAKTLGPKSIRHGRVYQAAKITVEQSQTDCQRACVEFEQASNDHRFAKQAIKEAELKLRQLVGDADATCVIPNQNDDLESCIDFKKLAIQEDSANNLQLENLEQLTSLQCDRKNTKSIACGDGSETVETEKAASVEYLSGDDKISNDFNANRETNAQQRKQSVSDSERMQNAARLSEELNKAIVRLVEAEQKRLDSERQHLDQANKLMIAQENLLKLEREHGYSIRRSQMYFEETRRFNGKLDTVKGDISRISEQIMAAKQAYARTLRELEQFSQQLHDEAARTSKVL